MASSQSSGKFVYVVLENGELSPVLYYSYEEARAAVLEKYTEQLEEERKDCAECAWMRMASQVDVAENTETGTTKLYVEKEIYITIQRYKAIVPKHTPGIKLTDEERANKGINHTYGLCCSCDTGLDCCTDFIYYNHPSGAYALCMCVACNRYYTDTGTVFDFDNF